jgi:MFS transporter, FHS family, L-fucose permease
VLSTPSARHEHSGPSALVIALFFACGFSAALNDVLVPYLKSLFALSYARVMLVQGAFFLSYFVFALPGGRLIEWLGYQRTMFAGLLTAALGAVMFLPAASVPAFWLFLAALMLMAAGLTALQVAANPYIASLGSPGGAPSRLNLAQGFISLGQMVAQPFGSWLLLHQAARSHQASLVNRPYVLLSCAFLLLGIMIQRAKLPVAAAIEVRHSSPEGVSSLLLQRQFVRGVTALFLYMGAEVSIASFLILYLTQPSIGAMTQKAAAMCVSLYWGGAMVGRFVGARLLRQFAPGRVLGVAATLAITLVTVSVLSSGRVAAWSMVSIGLVNSVMVANIYSMAIEGLGPLTGMASGILVSTAVGAAILPLLQGVLADRVGIHHAFFLSALCYVYVAFYGISGTGSAARAPSPLLSQS